MVQQGFYFDQSRCISCHTCVVACKDWHDIPAGPASWRKVRSIEQGKFPDLFVAYLSLACCNCAQPLCREACPAGAVTKRQEDGIVVVAKDLCLGKDICGACKDACPYDAPQFGAEENAKMQKCNFCLDRQLFNRPPICVSACPMMALDAGPMDKLMEKYGRIREASGFAYAEKSCPSIIFKLKPAD